MDDDLFGVFDETASRANGASKKEKRSRKRSLNGEVKGAKAEQNGDGDARMMDTTDAAGGESTLAENGQIEAATREQKRQRRESEAEP
ncbi:hypothetical protein LTR53_020382, partial [Teratosphaeriaceae sp. CCFEE 6253]